VRYVPCRVSRHTERKEPGPRRGHTAARVFEGRPVLLASDALSCVQRSEGTADRLTGPIAALAVTQGPR
jgi:hypothetical protein